MEVWEVGQHYFQTIESILKHKIFFITNIYDLFISRLLSLF